MNTALQCLLSTTELTHFFLRGFHQKEVNVDNPLGHQGKVAESFHRLVDQMHSHTETWTCLKNHWGVALKSFEPNHFKQSISHLNDRMFAGYMQQDSQELLGAVLDAIHEDCNRIMKKPYVENVVGDGKNDTADAALAWERYKMRNDSFVVDTFQGQMRSRVTCAECKNMSVSFDPSMYLGVSFKHVVPPSSIRVVVKFVCPSDLRPVEQVSFDQLPQAFHYDCDVKVLTAPADTFASLVKSFEEKSPGLRFIAVTFTIPYHGIAEFDMLVPASEKLPVEKSFLNYVILEMPPLVADAWLEADRLATEFSSLSKPVSSTKKSTHTKSRPAEEDEFAEFFDKDSSDEDAPLAPAHDCPDTMLSPEQMPGIYALVSEIAFDACYVVLFHGNQCCICKKTLLSMVRRSHSAI
jgi:hypothetical protein